MLFVMMWKINSSSSSSCPSPMRRMKWCNGHGSWVMWVMGQLCDGSHGSWVTKDDPFPSLSGVSIFSWIGQRSRSPDVKNHRKLASCLLTGGRSSADGLQTRPTPLLGFIYCRRLLRHSATGRTAAYHAGIWDMHSAVTCYYYISNGHFT